MQYTFICPTCRKTFFDTNYIKNRKFCSNACKRRVVGTEERSRRSRIAIEKGYGKWMAGKRRPHSVRTRLALSVSLKGRHLSPKTEFQGGLMHPGWKGGKKLALKRSRERIRNNPKARLRQSVSALMSTRLRRRAAGGSGKSKFTHLSYSTEDLFKHLESLFLPGMSWDNYGKWHVDHIIPDSSFNYTSVDDPEFQQCWALDNLQPLWAVDNLKKGRKVGT